MNFHPTPPLFFHKLTWWALLSITTFVFTSLSLSAIHHILVFVLLFWLVPQWYRGEWSFKDLPKSSWALLALFAAGLFSNIVNFNDIREQGRLNMAFGQLKYFFLAVAALIAYRQLFQSHYMTVKKWRLLQTIFFSAVTIATVSGIVALQTGFHPLRLSEPCHSERACGLYGMYMSYGYGIQFFMLFLTALLLFYKRLPSKLRIPYWVLLWLFALNGVGFVLAKSRGAEIGFVLALPFFFLHRFKKAFLGLSLLLLLGGAVFHERIFNFVFDQTRSQSQSLRQGYFYAAVRSFMEHPLTGLGVRNFDPHSKEIKQRLHIIDEFSLVDRFKEDFLGGPPPTARQIKRSTFQPGQAHNNFLEYLVSFGLFGFLALFFFHYYWFKELYCRKDLVGEITLPMVVALFVSGLMQHTLADGPNTFLIMQIYSLSQLTLRSDFFERRKKVIVTGGNGYIGQHMCKKLVHEGYDVHIIDNHSTSPKEFMHSYGTLHSIGMQDALPLLKELAPIEGVFHFAAKSVVPEGEEKPLEYYKNNVANTLSFLEAVQSVEIPYFVFSSTCAVFGNAQNDQIDEEHPQNPITVYGRSKLMVETILKDLAKKNLLNVVILRYFNVAGLSKEGELGEHHCPETHLIPNLCRSITKGHHLTFHLYGNDHETPDGSCIRDYIHVEDLIEAHYQSYLHLKKNQGLHHFNVGSGVGYSVYEVIKQMEEVSQKKIQIQISPKREGDAPKLVACPQKITKEIGFTPQHQLKDCLGDTLKWWQVNKEK